MKSYKNLIIIGLLLLGAAVFLVAKFVNLDSALVNAGYYQERITILSTADIHGHIVYDEETGGYYTLDEVSVMVGMPLMKHIINEVRKENKNTLLLDSEDLFHGTNEANTEKGKGVVEVANLRGYDAMTPGNHDFNFGFGRLLEIRGQHLGDDDDRELVKKLTV